MYLSKRVNLSGIMIESMHLIFSRVIEAYSHAKRRLSDDMSFHPTGGHFKVTGDVISVTVSSSFQSRLAGGKRGIHPLASRFLARSFVELGFIEATIGGVTVVLADFGFGKEMALLEFADEIHDDDDTKDGVVMALKTVGICVTS